MSRNSVRILLVDDEASIRNLLRISLESHGFQVSEAENGQRGLKMAVDFHPHLIILDLGLPDVDGLEVLKSLREWTKIPILILTVSDDEATKVQLLDAGANDYLTKPFSMPELLARVRVALRGTDALEATPVFRSGGLEVDLSQHSVSVNSTLVKLTATEFALLRELVRNRGKVVAQGQLLAEVWGPHGVEQTHYLRIYIAQLRRKLEADPSAPKHILTEPGVGYKLI
jgi:two-component system KDP operon response regulator KdpE